MGNDLGRNTVQDNAMLCGLCEKMVYALELHHDGVGKVLSPGLMLLAQRPCGKRFWKCRMLKGKRADFHGACGCWGLFENTGWKRSTVEDAAPPSRQPMARERGQPLVS